MSNEMNISVTDDVDVMGTISSKKRNVPRKVSTIFYQLLLNVNSV